MPSPMPAGAAGFPGCPACPYLATGAAGLCLACAAHTLPPLAEHRCVICGQTLSAAGAACGNRLCSDADRQFTRAGVIAMKRDPLDRVIKAYKYDYQYPASRGWATIFGRLVVAHLDRHAPVDGRLILAVPTFVGVGSPTKFHHTEEVIRRAAAEDLLGHWDWDDMDDPTIVKTGATPASAAGGKTLAHAREVASQLRPLLAVRHPERIRGRDVTVYDDVFTTGYTVNEVARALKAAGAADVSVLVLARAPWR